MWMQSNRNLSPSHSLAIMSAVFLRDSMDIETVTKEYNRIFSNSPMLDLNVPLIKMMTTSSCFATGSIIYNIQVVKLVNSSKKSYIALLKGTTYF